jgi:hypothetical protein
MNPLKSLLNAARVFGSKVIAVGVIGLIGMLLVTSTAAARTAPHYTAPALRPSGDIVTDTI